MALQAYVDDSVEAGKVLVLAGYVASAEAWSTFSGRWQELLDMRPPWRSFKMADIASSKDAQRWERAGWFYRVIEDHAVVFIAVAIDLQALDRVIEELHLPDKYRNPYLYAFRCVIDFTAQYQHEFNIEEPIDFIFDDRSEKDTVRKGFELFRKTRPDDIKARIGREPRFEDDEEFLPLQAADLLAWHVRRHWLRHGTIVGQEPLDVSWKSTRPGGIFPGYAFNLDYNDLRFNLTSIHNQLVRAGLLPPPQQFVIYITVTFSCDLSRLDGPPSP